MTQLHARGIELVVELLEAAELLDRFTPEEHRRLLRDTAHVLADLLKRDVPTRDIGYEPSLPPTMSE